MRGYLSRLAMVILQGAAGNWPFSRLHFLFAVYSTAPKVKGGYTAGKGGLVIMASG